MNSINKVDIAIFGADGQQGIIASRFLLQKGYRIICIDRYSNNIQKELQAYNPITKTCDISNYKLIDKIITEYEPKIILNLSSLYDDRIAELCLVKKINYIDIFSTSDMGDKLFYLYNNYNKLNFLNLKQHNNSFSLLTGCGSAPGITGLLFKSIEQEFDIIENIESGFSWTSNVNSFVPPFNIYDAAFELHKDCAVIRNGNKQKIPSKSIKKTYDFPLLGKQTLYAIDHAELDSFYNASKRKGIKNVSFFAGFPQHCLEVLNSLNSMQLLDHSKTFLFKKDEKEIKVSSIDLLEIISKHIKIPENYIEFEVLYTTIEGYKNGKPYKKTAICEVPPIIGWEKFGSNVDTGITAAIASIFTLSNKAKPGCNYLEAAVPIAEFIKELTNFGFKFNFSADLLEI